MATKKKAAKKRIEANKRGGGKNSPKPSPRPRRPKK
jgi:hypothetical protein